MDKKYIIFILYLIIFILNVSTQTVCPKNCITCSTSTACQTCSPGYYVDSTAQCRPCNTGCATCLSPSVGSTVPKCTKCIPGFNLNSITFDCFTCSTSCLTCSQTANNCVTCPEGTIYKLVSGLGTCYRDPKCLNNVCLACKVGSGTLCDSCKSGNFLRSTGQCSTCPYPCVNCKYTINSLSIIQNYNLGIIEMHKIITIYNEYIIQLVDVMNRYKKYMEIQMLNPTVVFNIFLQDANYSLIPSAVDLNFTGPNFQSELNQVSPYFNVLIDSTYFLGISNLIYNKINVYSSKFVAYTQSLANSTITNTTNSTNTTDTTIFDFLGFNYTDTDGDGIVDIGNSTDDWRDYFGNYDQYFGNGTQQKLSINMFYQIIYTQSSFKRYFNGTLANLTGANSSQFFNFQSAPPNCLDCVKGFYFDAIQTACKTCSPNCIDCNSTTCLTCLSGFYLNTLTNQCQPCKSPCSTCFTIATKCSSCIVPFTLTTANTCIQCIPPCSTCSLTNSSICIDCIQPYSLKANTAGACFRCAQDICKTCSTTNTSICIQCSDGFSLVSGKCELCPAKCIQCSTPTATNNRSECYLCEQRYVLNTTSKLCDQCGSLCLQCKLGDSKTCLNCQKGTYLSTNGLCNLCMPACLECINGESCSVYKEGVMLFGTQVISCRPGCKKCDNQNPQKCLICDDMFALAGITCVKCAPGCSACDLTNPLICTLCPSNRVLNNGKCIQCPTNCTTCTSQTVCTGCTRGFILSSTNCVDASSICPANCLQCNANKNCKQCSFGFVISSAGTCVQCVSSCGASCDASNPLVCTGCTVGFESRQGKCIRCPLYCKKCSGGMCSECDLGYQLTNVNSTIVCAKSCLFPCKKCSATKCFECTTNYTLTSGKCQPDTTCGGKGCLFCPTGSYKSDTGSCVKCNNNCASCSSTDCLVCRQGYYLSNSSCIVCPQGSQVCFDDITSVLCKPGYLFQALNFDSNAGSTTTYSSKCKACDSPCKQCMFLPTLCVSCINDQYRLNGTSCLRKKVVGSEIRFGLSYEAFLQGGKAQQILSKLSGTVKGKIIITFMRQGSTVFGMAVSGDGSTSESALANSVNTAVSGGSLGIPVQSSSVGIFVQDAPFIDSVSSTESQVNTGLIVGIIIGVVVLIIITVVLVCKLRKKPKLIQVRPESNTELVDLRLKKKKGSTVQYSTLSSFANNSKVLFA